MSKSEQVLTPLAVRRRLKRILRTVKDLAGTLRELEDSIPEPAPEALHAMMTTPKAPLTEEAHILPVLREVRLTLEEACSLARRNAKGWCAEDVDDLECALHEIAATRMESRLRDFMSRLYQAATGRSWVKGLEFDFWAAVNDEEVSSLRLTEEQMAELRRLSDLAGWFFLDRKKNQHFAGDDVWEALYAAWRSTRKAHSAQPAAAADLGGD